MSSAIELKELSSSINILYVEDEAIIRESMERTLKKFFKNTFVAKHGQEAYEIFKKEDIDIILTDINMPIMCGSELISEINKTEKSPIIIVLSAHDESRLLKSLINAGINNFLNKPVEKEALMKILYKNCSIITNRRLVETYSKELEQKYNALSRKNAILEQKVNMIASCRNKIIKEKESKNSIETDGNENYFKTLLIEDREELRDLSAELDTYILMIFQHMDGINVDYIGKLSRAYIKYSSIINGYSDFCKIASSLYSLGQHIISLEDKFLEDIPQTGIYLESLQFSLESYRQNIWDKEAKDPTFYNASLINDIQVVLDFLESKEIEDNEIEFF